MKRTISVILALVMALMLCLPAMAATAVVPSVTVNATAKVQVDPDIAYISLGVRTENANSKTAKDENAKLMNEVLKAIYAQGIDEDDVQTSGLSLSSRYKWDDDGNRTLVGYTVNNTLKITVHDLDKVGTVVDAAINAGANQFNNVSFGLEDEEEYYVMALEAATKKAKKRAAAIAKANGSSLGGAISFTNSNVNYNSYIYYDEVVEKEADMAEGAATANSIGATITSGQITVSATVSAVYELK